MILPATHKGGDLICAEVIQGLGSSLSAARMLWPIIQWKAFKEREELWKRGILGQEENRVCII